MPRNLDLTALRSFVTVAETGGVTKAAHQLHLTQSAVSMQLKRLEVSLDQPLLDRSGRGVALTNQGEQLLSYGRRMLALNDEVMARMTGDAFEGEIKFGVPADIVFPNIPHVLQRFDREYPRVRVNLFSSNTRKLKAMIESGDLDLILTTEDECGAPGETISTQRLVWVGAPGGTAFRARPLRLAFEHACLFRPWVQRALDEAGIAWEMAVDTNSTRTVEASVSADLAIHAMLECAISPHLEPIAHGGALPDLPSTRINMYRALSAKGALVDALEEMVRGAYGRMAVAA
ncbi:MAG: LysR family transcriptional regulator [Proteobacteria bacterium]|nr:LysR family transcriptional regulator [Pseudomonadota bacterium]